MAILDFFISQLIKTGCFLEVIWQLGHALVAIAVVER